jgi:hypothetical protein
MNPRLEQRKAPQTARDFNCEHRGHGLHVPMPLHPSAQADIAFSQPRIHSPRLAGACSPSDSGFAPGSSWADESTAGTA